MANIAKAKLRIGNILTPDPLDSDRQYARFYHLDLPSLDNTEVKDEFYTLRSCLWKLPPDHWLRERVKALNAELYKRRGNTGYDFREKPKPKLAEGVIL